MQKNTAIYLTIDIGNTRAKITLFHNEAIIARFHQATLSINWLETLFEQYPIRAAILSTVVENTEAAEAWLAERIFFIKLDHKTPIPIKNAYQTPETLGKDRLAAAVGAFVLYPHQNCLVVDAGTCITYEFVGAEGVYKGGNIAPGLAMRFRSMHEFTAKLPLVQKQRLDGFIGFNTETAMRTGAQLGLCLEIEGFLRLYEAQFGTVQLLLTGGDAEIIAQSIDRIGFINKDIVLIGLYKILDYNANVLEKLD